MTRDKKFAKKLKAYSQHNDEKDKAWRKYREMKKEHRRFNDKRR